MNRSNLLLLALLITLVCSTQSAFAEKMPFKVLTISQAINNHAVLPDRPLPAVCSPDTTMTLVACRGEYEPASFVVEANEPLNQVEVHAGPLRSSAGALPSDAIDIRVVQPYFREVGEWPMTIPWLLVHDPDMLTIDDEPQPAAAIENPRREPWSAYTRTNRLTRAPIDALALRPVDIEGIRQFWITVHVPLDAKPGSYTSTITIEPANAPAKQLTLELTVLDFELLPPKPDYSVYYPAYLDPKLPSDAPLTGNSLPESQILLELENMVAHGCTNPNIYGSKIVAKKDGSLDFSMLEKILSLRTKAGMKNELLYLVGHPLGFGKLTDAQKDVMKRTTRQIVDWTKARGCREVYFMAQDEAKGEVLKAEREGMKVIHEGGGKVFVACDQDFYESVGDLLDLPVMMYPATHIPLDIRKEFRAIGMLTPPKMVLDAMSPQRLLDPKIEEIIAGTHERGYKIFTYFDPVGGVALPEVHRRIKGIGMWKSGTDGTMTWCYSHIAPPDPQYVKGFPAEQMMIYGYIWRGQNSVVDTLSWEAYREGVDDARYFATLTDSIEKATAEGKHAELIQQTGQWLDALEVDTNLDEMREEIVRRIVALKE
ncbi:MAG: hypothetical protein ACC628_15545 [Pirellulaceae bacterium]